MSEAALVNKRIKPVSQTSVGVIIVNYNGGERLETCLSALKQQTRQPDRIILVDNNSRDFVADNIQKNFPDVEIVVLEKNIGFAAANNKAVDLLASVEYVVLLNPDAYAKPDWLEKYLVGASAHPECSFFACRMLSTDGESLDGTGDVYHVSGASWRRDYGNPADRRRQSGEIFLSSGAAALFKRDVYLEAGGLNEDFFCYMEDVDLGFRIQLLGYRCFYISDAVVIHEGSALVGQHSDFQVYHGHRNLVWVYVMNMPSPWIWVYLPQHLLYNVASILLYIFRAKTAVILRAKYDAIKGLARAWRQRGLIQARLRVSTKELRGKLSHGLLAPYLYRDE